MVFNAMPALLILMVVVSPLLWEHHPVFAILPFLLLPRSTWSSGRWAAFALGYAVVFLLPTYDVFPFSFARLAALVGWLPLSSDRTG